MSIKQGKAVELRVDGQWYFRGKNLPFWYECATAGNGSRSTVCNKADSRLWPLLERIAELESTAEEPA